MLVRLVVNKRLYYGYRVLLTLFNRSPIAIARKWNVATHSEAAATGGLAEDNLSNESSKKMISTNRDSK